MFDPATQPIRDLAGAGAPPSAASFRPPGPADVATVAAFDAAARARRRGQHLDAAMLLMSEGRHFEARSESMAAEALGHRRTRP